MTKEDKITMSDEVAMTYELYNFRISFSEFKDIIELGAEMGYQLAINKASLIKKQSTFEMAITSAYC